MDEQELQQTLISLLQAQACHERIVNELIHYMIELDMEGFENLLDTYILSKGIDKAINQVIFPFLERIGILWLTNNIHPVQEHLVSNVVRQKLVVGIEAVSTHVSIDKTFVLFLPEGEYHEMGLLYACYLLKRRGAKVLYLGANVPVNDIEFICRHKSPDYLYTHLTCVTGSFNFEKFAAQKNHCIKNIPLIVSGQLARAQPDKTPPTIHLKRSLSEVLEFISAL
jgi:methanogenic corrinoid protein MtbC1